MSKAASRELGVWVELEDELEGEVDEVDPFFVIPGPAHAI